MTKVQTRVTRSGGVLGPLTLDKVNTVRKFIDKSLKAKDSKITEKEVEALEELDGHLGELVQQATTVGQVM